MNTIKFANGATYECSLAVSMTNDGGTAFIALPDVTFSEAAAIFSNEDATAEMEYVETRFVGYTSLVSLSVQPYGIQAVLRGGHDERIN